MRLYVDTSAVLRSVVERGSSPSLEVKLSAAQLLVSSRLALVESARVFHRLRLERRHPEAALDALERAVDEVWARTQLWELTREVCKAAAELSPRRSLRTLEALHLATYFRAIRKVGPLELLSADQRLLQAAGV